MAAEKFQSMKFNESIVENTFINQIPAESEHGSQQKNNQGSIHEKAVDYDHYYSNSRQKNSIQSIQQRVSSQRLNEFGKSMMDDQMKYLIGKAADAESSKRQVQQLKIMVNKLSQELRAQKRKGFPDTTDLGAKYEFALIQIQKKSEELRQKNKEIAKLEVELAQTKKLHQKNQKLLKMYSQGKSASNLSINSNQIQNYKRKMSEYERTIKNLNRQIDEAKQQRLSQQFSPMKSSIKNSKSFFDMENFDIQRFKLKLLEKNRDYEQLYHKYQTLENDYNALEELNSDLERESKFLSGRLKDFEIHTEGDEMVGELQNKLVLMSTELIRLEQLNRTKNQEARNLQIKLRDIELRFELLEKDNLEKEGILITYKQQLREFELKANQRQQFQFQAVNSDLQSKISLLNKEIERINHSNREKVETISMYQLKISHLQDKINRLEKDVYNLQRENKQLQNTSSQKRQVITKTLNLQVELEHYKKLTENLKQEIRRLEDKIQSLKQEKDQVFRAKDEQVYQASQMQDKLASYIESVRKNEFRLAQKDTEIKELSHKYDQKLISKNAQIQKLTEKISKIERELQRSSKFKSQLPKIEELLHDIKKLEMSEMTLKIDIGKYEEKVAMIAQQNERLHTVIENLTKQSNQYRQIKNQMIVKDKKLRQLNRQNETINLKYSQTKQQIQSLRLKIRTNIIQQKDLQLSNQTNHQLKEELQILKEQIRLKNEDFIKIQRKYEIDIKQKYKNDMRVEELKGQLAISKIGSTTNIDDIDSLQREIKKLNEHQKEGALKIKELKSQISDNQSNFRIISNEIQRLNKVLQEKLAENVRLNKQIDLLRHKVQSCEKMLEQRSEELRKFSNYIDPIELKNAMQINQSKVRMYEHDISLLKQQIIQQKQANIKLQGKIDHLAADNIKLEHRNDQLQQQFGQKIKSNQSNENNFKLLIVQVKNSNQRLEKSMLQIENHYIDKLNQKQRDNDRLRSDKNQYQTKIFQYQKKISQIQATYGFEMKEKNNILSNLSNSNHQTKEQIELIKRVKDQYEVKLALLSQELERMTYMHQKDTKEIVILKEKMKDWEIKIVSLTKDQQYTLNTNEILSKQIERLNHTIAKNIEMIKKFEKDGERKQRSIQEMQKNVERDRFTKNEQKRAEDVSVSLEHRELSTKVAMLQQFNAQLKRNTEQKSQQIQRLYTKIAQLQRSTEDANPRMRQIVNELKEFRESNTSLSKKLQIIIKENEQLVSQIQSLKRARSNQSQGNTQALVAALKEQKLRLLQERDQYLLENKELNNISHEFQSKLREAQNAKADLQRKIQRIESQGSTQRATRDINEPTKEDNEVYTLYKSNASKDIYRRYQLLESVNKKLSTENQCSRKQIVQYQFKMNKLKQEFEILNKIILDYKLENEKLKGLQRSNNHLPSPQINTYHSPQHSSNQLQTVRSLDKLYPPQNPNSPRPISNNNSIKIEYSSRPMSQQNFGLIKNSLIEEIDRLNAVNASLQIQVHDLRINSMDNTFLRKRIEQNLSIMVLLFAEVQSLRIRLKSTQTERQSLRANSINPSKSKN